MPLPTVAIVGRPNVGKSSLLNALARERVSIVDPTAGVTRDRVSAICEFEDQYIELVDTGGYGLDDADQLTRQIEQQIRRALDAASLVLFVTDVRAGLTPLDRQVATMLRRAGVPVLLVVNKCDSQDLDAGAAEFAPLGFGEPVCVAAAHRRGRAELSERLARCTDPSDSSAPPPDGDENRRRRQAQRGQKHVHQRPGRPAARHCLRGAGNDP